MEQPPPGFTAGIGGIAETKTRLHKIIQKLKAENEALRKRVAELEERKG
jgi:hypothetical protein